MSIKTRLAGIWRQYSIVIIISALFTLGIAIIAFQSSALKRANNEKRMLQNNIEALGDSVRITYNKLKEAEYNKQSFVVQDPEQMQYLLDDLYQELQKIKGEVQSINKVVAKIEDRDTVPLYVSVPSPNKYSFLFDSTFSPGNRQAFGGFIDTEDPTKSRVTSRDLEMSLYTGLKKVNGKPTIYARTDFPGVKFNLEGAEIDPNYFAAPTSGEKLVNYATLNFGQNMLSYYYGGEKKGQIELFQPRVDASIGVGLNIKKLLSRK